MEALIKHIADIIRPRCISGISAELAAIDVVTWINDSRNKCECPNEIKTGCITENLCNICGRPERKDNLVE